MNPEEQAARDRHPPGLQDFLSFAAVIQAAQSCARVARLIDGEVVYGTARRVTGTEPRVRDGRIEVTSDAGWEISWPLAELAAEIADGIFVVNPTEADR